MSRILVALLAVSVTMACIGQTTAVAAHVTKPIVKIVDITVNSIDVDEEGLVANATVLLNIAGRAVTQDVQIPLAIDGSEGDVCDILHLALGPIDLNLLGLVVELDDCQDGPVIVDITAAEGEGLLGDLLCSIAEGLAAGNLLEDILSDLTDEELAEVLDGVVASLNAVFDELLENGTAETAFAASRHNNRCDILLLAIPEGISLTLLGLTVDTSPICLDVYALRGRGNLLGNLLCQLSGLLDRSAKHNAIDNAVKKIHKQLKRMRL